MTLVNISDFYPDYKERIFDNQDIKNYSVYSETEDKVGGVHDLLVDESGRFRYLVIDTGFWFFGKQVLLPVGRARVDHSDDRVYAMGMTKEQAERLPKYDSDMTIDYDYEERVRGVYRSTAAQPTSTPDTYKYDNDPTLYDVDETNHQKFKLYQERLIADKDRYKAGEVAVGKKVESKTAKVAVPVENERVVIERTTPTGTTPVTPGATNFKEGEVARVEVYEESAQIDKQAFVREEVEVRKEVDRDTVEASETIRRETLDVDTHGNPVVNKNR
ncbi:DUF2382 domain-containing protein [Lusitaniella coriacea]|uniref:DUF2382 domain-containing protein n=1 Tax=Lusitaniella coriacea TaxID=1983105 RepID=UPI003CF58388